MTASAKKRLKNPKFTPDIGKASQFKKNRQPTPTAKSNGWQKKKFTREVMREFLQSNFNLSPAMRQQFAEKYGINPDDKIAMGAAILMQQGMAAMSGNPNAKQSAELLFNQGLGQPKQEIEVSMPEPITKIEIVHTDKPKE